MAKTLNSAPAVAATSPQDDSVAPTYQLSGSDRPLDLSTVEDAPPTFTKFPTTYKIGTRTTPQPLVSVAELRQHLTLLGAFHDLKTTVEGGSEGVTAALEPAVRWSVFVAMAVYRFEVYLESVIKAKKEGACPPLDVALVWHTYALNPRWYSEDSARHHPYLERTGGFPLEKIASYIDKTSLIYQPASDRKAGWETSTELPFDPLQSLATSQGRPIIDPSNGEVLFVDWVNDSGTGYAQQGFEKVGKGGFKITHEVLGVAKLVRDIQLMQGDENGTLAGVLLTPNEPPYPSLSKNRIQRLRLSVFAGETFREGDPVKLGDTLLWSMAGAREKMLDQFRRRPSRALNTMLSAYTRGELFSLDLVTAVLRQGTFVQKMVDLGWCLPDRFSRDEEILQRSVARYHAFLDLLNSQPSNFLVPTLDIDLAWHTHQLSARQYMADMLLYVQRFIDHDDRVEEGSLATSYDTTARAWQARFNVPYSICGCPLPDENKVARLSSKISNKLGFNKRNAALPPSTLLGSRDSDADATHASEHNSITLVDHPDSKRIRERREKEYQSRIQRDEKLFAKGKFDPDVMERRRREDAHDAAFLYPMAFYPYYGFYGYPGYIGGACAAVGGNTMSCDGIGGAGTGAGGCMVGAGACAGGMGSAGACGGSGGACGGGSGACAGGGGSCSGGGGGCGGGGGGCGGGGS